MLKPALACFWTGGVICLLCVSLPAAADLTVTSEVRVVRPAEASPYQNGETPAQEQQTETRDSTVYFRGDFARVESGEGPITLYNLKTGRVYVLSAADKTYTTLSLRDFLKLDRFAGPLVPSQDTPDGAFGATTTVHVTLTKDTLVPARTFAGLAAQNYSLTGNVLVSSERPVGGGGEGGYSRGGGGGRRGRRGGGFPGGGFPGGGFPGGGSSPSGASGRRSAPPTRTAQFDGEIWLAAPNVVKSTTKIAWVPLLQPGMPSAQLTQSLANQITKAKGFPLATSITLTGQRKQASENSPARLTVSSTVKTISDTPLDETLFKIPADYQRSDAR